MNQREKLVAIGVAVVVIALVGWYASYWYFEAVDTRDRRIQSLSAEVKKKQAEQREAQAATKRLADYEVRSLPPDVELAKSLYEQWLLQTANETKLSDVKMTAPAPTGVKNTYTRMTFTVNAQGELPQLVEFLYRFQRLDWLHRIETMKFTPLNDSRKINANLTISALSVNSAPRSKELAESVSEKYKQTDVDEYSEPILNRNFFGAPNRKPEIDVASRNEATIDRAYELSVKAKEPDPLDKVTFSLVKSADPAAKLDPQSGKFTWRPKAKGEFAFEIVAKDDGLPSKTSDTKVIQITVKDPPPPTKVTETGPKKPTFDDARYTVLTAVIDNSGTSEIWLHVRPKGETRILQTGDKFAIGSVKGEVSEIGVDDAILLVDGKLRRLVVGQTLAVSEGSD